MIQCWNAKTFSSHLLCKFLSHQTTPTLGAAVPIVSSAIGRHLRVPDDQDASVVAGFKRDAAADLARRWSLVDGHAPDTLLLSVYLDPRFKTFCFVADPRERQNTLDRAAARVSALVDRRPQAAVPSNAPPPTDSPYLRDMQDIFGAEVILPLRNGRPEDELERYRREPCASMWLVSEDTDRAPRLLDPLAWWRDHESAFPRLAALARRYLSVTATSVASERAFSKSGWIVNKRRCSLSDQSVSLLLFLSANRHHHTALAS